MSAQTPDLHVPDLESRITPGLEVVERRLLDAVSSSRDLTDELTRHLAVAGGKDGWFTNEWADSLNYTNVSRDTDTSHTPVTFEQVLTWDPQVLLVTGKGMSNMTANSVLTNSVEGVDLSTLSSVKSGRVYSTGLGMWNWFTPNPDAPIVANWLGASLYPEQFSDVDLVSMTKDYYQKMYNFTLTDEQARAIVNPDSAS